MPAEQLLLVNPRRRRRRGRMPPALAAYWAKRRRRVRAHGVTHRRRRRRRSVSINRRRHRVRAHTVRRARRRYYVRPHMSNRRRRRRHHANRRMRRHHRNPRLFSGALADFTPALYGAGGALALDVALGYLNPYLPASFQAAAAGQPVNYLNTGVKVAGALGIGFLGGKMLGRQKGVIMGAGALTVVLYSALRQLVSSMLPAGTLPLAGLGAYQDYTPMRMGAYMAQPGLPSVPTGAAARLRGLGYTSPAAVIGAGASSRYGLGGLSAYIRPGDLNVASTFGESS